MKKVLKRGIALVLSCMMLFQCAPMEHVQAAENNVFLNEQTESDQIEDFGVTYVALENSVVATSETQKIVIGYKSEMQISRASLVLEDEKTEILKSVDATSFDQGMLFEVTQQETYETSMLLKTLSVIDENGKEYELDFATIGMEVRYGVNKVIETKPDSVLDDGSIEDKDVKVDVATVDSSDDSSIDNIQDSLKESNEDVYGTTHPGSRMLLNNIVVVLDPGHDNKHHGATGNGLREEALTLKIAQYCKAELEQYKGVTVYMTRDSENCPHPDMASAGEDNAARVAYAKSVGASAYVSIHLNSSTNTAAQGVEVYYPNDHYLSNIGTQGGQLAQSVLNNLVSLGIADRGTKIRDSEPDDETGIIDTYEDGSVSDYYGVIRNSKKSGIPGIIIEHAFISNASDASNYLSSESSLQSLGIADATGIAQYYGLKKATGPWMSIRGLSISESNSGVTIEVNYSAKNTNNKFQFLYLDPDTKQWGMISDWTSSDKVTWQPEKKDYTICVNAKAEDGVTTDQLMSALTPSVDFTNDFLKIQAVNAQAQSSNISLQASALCNDTQAEYRWRQYDVAANKWSVISEWSTASSTSWRPKAGYYWINLQMRTKTGLEDTSTIDYYNPTNYSSAEINLAGICWQVQKRGIDLGVYYSTKAESSEFKWMAYNLDTKKWSLISDWYSGNWTTWKPAPGNYWVYVQARNSMGGTADYTTCFNVGTDYSHEKIDLNGMCWQVNSTGIDVGTAYSTNADSVQFKWLSYNLDTKKWSLISDWYSGNWMTWKPHSGNYWLQVQAKTDDGTTTSQTICFAVGKNYDEKLVELSGVCIQEQSIGTNAGVAYTSNDKNVQFKWQLYDVKKQKWSLLTDWTNGNWVTFYPGTGDYWLYVTAKTSDGHTASYCTGYTVSARYLIMGESDVTADQLARFYQKNKWGTFPEYYASTDAPTLMQFCQMYIDECKLEGVKPEVAFAQAMKETAYLHYPADVRIEQNNFAGIGATGNGEPGNSFKTVRIGIRAQVQHLKAYGCKDPLLSECVDPRFSGVKRGIAPYVEYLGSKENPEHTGWATAEDYGNSIVNTYIKGIMESK